jgi:hypothetical protein
LHGFADEVETDIALIPAVTISSRRTHSRERVWRGEVDGLVCLFADDGVFTIIDNGKERLGNGEAKVSNSSAY